MHTRRDFSVYQFSFIYKTVESYLRNDTKKLQLENGNQLQAKKRLMQEST